jgi:hypothetical protein
MRRRRKPAPSRIEPPAWYVAFDPAAFDEPDGHELRMIDGCRGYGEWPAELHQIHAKRRWEQARHAYRRRHPALAEQEFNDILARRAG